MKVAGFNQGQYGDLIMNTVACRAIKTEKPDAEVTFQISSKYKDCAPLFRENLLIDDIYILDGYGPEMSPYDIEHYKRVGMNYVFNPMPRHQDLYWYNHVENQTEEVCNMHGINPPVDLSVQLNQWFNVYPGYQGSIALGFGNRDDSKGITFSQFREIVDYIEGAGYHCLILGPHPFPEMSTHQRCTHNADFFQSVRVMLSCKFMITVDSGLSWAAGGYKFPIIGLYSKVYPDLLSSKVYQPINPNAIYLEGDRVLDIPIETILSSISNML